MNRITCVLALLLGFLPLLSARAQGTINFMNRVLPAGIDAPVFNVDGVTKLDGGAFVAQLYAGASADSLAPFGATVAFMTGTRAGYFSGGTRIIPLVAPGATAFVQVRVWESAWGSTFETAWAAGSGTGVSAVLNVTTGGESSPPTLPGNLIGLESFKLEAPVPAFITAHPLDREVIAGNSVTFTVAGSGTAPLSYRWRKNGLDIPRATSSTLALENVQPADEADYVAIVQNFFGAATSEAAHLSVLVPPAIAAQPESKTAVAGENVALSVAAEGTAPLSFQWRFGGADLPGKTASTLALENVQPAAAGTYSVVVTNHVGVVASAAASLNVHYRLTVNPSAGGSVTTAPAQASYAPDSTVTLTATPSAGFAFLGWNGDASGTANPLTVTMTAHKIIVANFTPTFTLTTSVTGEGSVSAKPAKASYVAGEVVQVTATPAAGSAFVSWSGVSSATTPTISVTMDGNKTLTANFKRLRTLSLVVTGQGIVTRTPDAASYLDGSVVQLTAKASSGWQFVGWTGAVNGLTDRVSITMDADKYVGALFLQLFTVSSSVEGNGAVSWEPVQATYLDGTVVQLTAQAAEGWQLTGWSGAASGSAASVSLTLDADKTVTATFKQLFAVSTKVEGQGTVALDPAETSYLDGTTVSVTAAAAGYRFTGWSGDLSGTNSPVNLVVNGHKTVTANFSAVWTLRASATTGGSVAVNPEQSEYLHGSVVKVTAMARPGSAFTGWGGDASGTDAVANVTMDANKTVTASFAPTYTLAAFVTGDGSITVTPLKDTYLSGETVQLTATPAAGSAFVNWSGATSATTATISLTMDASESLTAHFKHARKLITSVVGQGTIIRSPDKAEYLDGEVVELTATAAEGWQFAGWEGAAAGSENRTSVVVNADAEAKAVFKPVAAARLTENGFSGKLTAEKGKVYVIEASANFKDWTPVATVTNLTGALEFHDPGATTAGLRFYRARAVE